MKEKCIKLSDEKIKSLSLEDFGSNIIVPIVQSYSLQEIVGNPYVFIVCNSELENIYVLIFSKDRLMLDFCADVVSYCHLYFGTSRVCVLLEGSNIHSGVVNYSFIFYK